MASKCWFGRGRVRLNVAARTVTREGPPLGAGGKCKYWNQERAMLHHDKPTYDQSKKRVAPRTREILRIAAVLDKTNIAREITLEWLENASKTELPDEAWSGDAFHHEADKRTFTAVRAKEESSDTWALRFVEPEEGEIEREWTTEIAIRERPGEDAEFCLRTLAKSTEMKMRVQPKVPGFLEHVAKECTMEQGAAKIEKEPWIVESEYDAANLAEFLVDPERRTPAFVLTVPEESEDPNLPLLDPLPLTADTRGIAKVIVLPAEYTWKLTNRFGKRLSVYRGAMRVYLTGFNDRADPEGGHDLFMPHRMDTPETASKLGSLLRWMAARESLRGWRLGHDVIPFVSAMLPSIELESATLAKNGASPSDQLEASTRHVSMLRDELKLSLEIQQSLTEENQSIEGRIRESESKLRKTQMRPRPSYDRGPRPSFEDRGRPQFDRGPRPSYGDRGRPSFDRGPRQFDDRGPRQFDDRGPRQFEGRGRPFEDRGRPSFANRGRGPYDRDRDRGFDRDRPRPRYTQFDDDDDEAGYSE